MTADADEAPAAPARVVLFDFDGVIVREDSFQTFIRESLHGARWRLLLPSPAWGSTMDVMEITPAG